MLLYLFLLPGEKGGRSPTTAGRARPEWRGAGQRGGRGGAVHQQHEFTFVFVFVGGAVHQQQEDREYHLGYGSPQISSQLHPSLGFGDEQSDQVEQ